jgi:hypothetical protein
MMRRLFLVLALAAMGLLTGSCRNQLPPLATLVGHLTGNTERTWALIEIVRQGASFPPAACTADDRYIFRRDSTYTLNNSTPCNAGEQTVLRGTWRFVGNGSELELVNEANFRTSFFLKGLDDTRLVLTFPDPVDPEFFQDWVFIRVQ